MKTKDSKAVSNIRSLTRLWLSGHILSLNIRGKQFQVCHTLDRDSLLKVVEDIDTIEDISSIAHDRKGCVIVIEHVLNAWINGHIENFDLNEHSIHIAPFTTGVKNDMSIVIEYIKDISRNNS